MGKYFLTSFCSEIGLKLQVKARGMIKIENGSKSLTIETALWNMQQHKVLQLIQCSLKTCAGTDNYMKESNVNIKKCIYNYDSIEIIVLFHI